MKVCIAFSNENDLKTAMEIIKAVCAVRGESDPLSSGAEVLPAKTKNHKHLLVGDQEEMERVGKILAEYNASLAEADGGGAHFIQHGATLPWRCSESGNITTNTDGSVTMKIATVRSGFFPICQKDIWKDGTPVGKKFTSPTVSTLQITIDLEGNFTVTQKVFQCKPEDPRQNMAGGLKWAPATTASQKSPVVYVHTSMEEVAKKVYHCGLESRTCDFFCEMVERLHVKHAAICKMAPATIGNSIDKASMAALKKVAAEVEAEAKVG